MDVSSFAPRRRAGRIARKLISAIPLIHGAFIGKKINSQACGPIVAPLQASLGKLTRRA